MSTLMHPTGRVPLLSSRPAKCLPALGRAYAFVDRHMGLGAVTADCQSNVESQFVVSLILHFVAPKRAHFFRNRPRQQPGRVSAMHAGKSD